jgi:hypothetical protein
MKKLRLKEPIIEEAENSVLVILRHESLGTPEQLVMQYLETHEEITNSIARDLTAIKSENTMKEVFYRLRDRGMLEQVPDKRGKSSAWRKSNVGYQFLAADTVANAPVPLKAGVSTSSPIQPKLQRNPLIRRLRTRKVGTTGRLANSPGSLLRCSFSASFAVRDAWCNG